MGSDVGRNDPCPCGSGRKYKRCCLRKKKEALPPPAQRLTEVDFEARIDEIVQSCNEIQDVALRVDDALAAKNRGPRETVLDEFGFTASALDDPVVEGIVEAFAYFGPTYERASESALVHKLIRSELSAAARRIYEQLTTQPLQAWCIHPSVELGGRVHPLFGPGQDEWFDYYGLLIPYFVSDDSLGYVGIPIEWKGVTVILITAAIDSQLLTTLEYVADDIRENTPDGFAREFEEELVFELIDHHVPPDFDDRSSNSFSWRPIYRPTPTELFYDILEELIAAADGAYHSVMAYLANRITPDDIAAFGDALENAYESVLQRHSDFDDLRRDLPLKTVRENLMPHEERHAALIEELKGHPVGVLLLDDDVLADSGLSAHAPISKALQLGGATGDTVVSSWRRYAAEQLWLQMVADEEDGQLALRSPKISVLTLLPGVVDEAYEATPIARLPMASGAKKRLLRCLEDEYQIAAEELRISDLPKFDSMIYDVPGIGDRTMERFKLGLVQWVRDWRWETATLDRQMHVVPRLTEEARAEIGEGLDELENLFGGE